MNIASIMGLGARVIRFALSGFVLVGLYSGPSFCDSDKSCISSLRPTPAQKPIKQPTLDYLERGLSQYLSEAVHAQLINQNDIHLILAGGLETLSKILNSKYISFFNVALFETLKTFLKIGDRLKEEDRSQLETWLRLELSKHIKVSHDTDQKREETRTIFGLRERHRIHKSVGQSLFFTDVSGRDLFAYVSGFDLIITPAKTPKVPLQQFYLGAPTESHLAHFQTKDRRDLIVTCGLGKLLVYDLTNARLFRLGAFHRQKLHVAEAPLFLTSQKSDKLVQTDGNSVYTFDIAKLTGPDLSPFSALTYLGYGESKLTANHILHKTADGQTVIAVILEGPFDHIVNVTTIEPDSSAQDIQTQANFYPEVKTILLGRGHSDLFAFRYGEAQDLLVFSDHLGTHFLDLKGRNIYLTAPRTQERNRLVGQFKDSKGHNLLAFLDEQDHLGLFIFDGSQNLRQIFRSSDPIRSTYSFKMYNLLENESLLSLVSIKNELVVFNLDHSGVDPLYRYQLERNALSLQFFETNQKEVVLQVTTGDELLTFGFTKSLR